MIDIEPFEPDDLDEIMEIELSSFTLPWSRKTYEELWPQGSIDIRVARIAGEMVGYYLVQTMGEEAELHTFAVRPEHRRAGIGRALLDHMLSGVRARGVRNVYLQVRPTNEAARNLYGRLGFRDVGINRCYYKDNDEDAMVMRLEVDL